MHFKSCAAFAAVSAITDAFLLPPQVSKADIDTINALPFEVAAAGLNSIVNLKCSGCPVPATTLDGNIVTLQHVDSTLLLNYTIEEYDSGRDRLLLNGVPIYAPNMPASVEPFTASQQFSKDQPFETQDNVRLGYEMSVRPVKKGQDLEIIAVHLQIFEVADKFIDGIDSVELNLLKTPSGKLMIASWVKKWSTSVSPIGSITDDKDCSSILCKWRAIVAAKLAHLKPGCSKGKGSKTTLATGHKGHKGQGRPHSHSGRPHSHGGHRHHRGGFAKFMHMLRRVTMHILIPVMIGIAAGLTASVIGMVFGQLVVFAWRTIRGGSPAYSPIEQDEEFDEESKDFIIEPQGPPPVYHDVILEQITEEKNEPEA